MYRDIKDICTDLWVITERCRNFDGRTQSDTYVLGSLYDSRIDYSSTPINGLEGKRCFVYMIYGTFALALTWLHQRFQETSPFFNHKPSWSAALNKLSIQHSQSEFPISVHLAPLLYLYTFQVANLHPTVQWPRQIEGARSNYKKSHALERTRNPPPQKAPDLVVDKKCSQGRVVWQGEPAG